MKVKLTTTQLRELAYKIEVMQCDGCEDSIAGNYGFADASLDAFAAKVKGSKGTLELSHMEAIAAIGELRNAADIARDNGDKSKVAAFSNGASRIVGAMASGEVMK